jgi:hypothetical protein
MGIEGDEDLVADIGDALQKREDSLNGPEETVYRAWYAQGLVDSEGLAHLFL